MKKNFKKSKFVILPALATLVLTGVASVTGTVAWFTATRNVSVSGMSFTAKSESNLLIAGDTLEGAAKRNENEFSGSLSQTIAAASLKPASTVDGKNFFKTTTAKANGAIQDDAKYESASNDSTKNEYYYLDYVFQLKAISLEASQSIYMNEISINYTADAGTADTVINGLKDAAKAFRIAFFIENEKTSAKKGEEFTADTTTVDNGLKFIYQPTATENQDPGKAVKQASTGDKVSSENDLGAVQYLTNKTAYVSNVATGTSSYYKGVARVWLEGEDKNCTSDLFQNAEKNWSVDLGFKLGSSDEMASEAKTNIAINVEKATAE